MLHVPPPFRQSKDYDKVPSRKDELFVVKWASTVNDLKSHEEARLQGFMQSLGARMEKSNVQGTSKSLENT